jgi:hypothetical protein
MWAAFKLKRLNEKLQREVERLESVVTCQQETIIRRGGIVTEWDEYIFESSEK